MRATAVVFAIVATALAGCGGDGGGDGSEPGVPGEPGRYADVCNEEGAQAHSFDRSRLLDGERTLRVAYADSSSRPPCELRVVEEDGGGIAVTLMTADPEVVTQDLRGWCAEARLAAPASKPIADATPGEDDYGAAVSVLGDMLETGRGCVRVPVAAG